MLSWWLLSCQGRIGRSDLAGVALPCPSSRRRLGRKPKEPDKSKPAPFVRRGRAKNAAPEKSSSTRFNFKGWPTRRLSNRVQLTTDGFRPYLPAVEDAFGADVDYAMLIKTYTETGQSDKRYSPGEIVNALPVPVSGEPKPWLISTSHIERQNLTIRMQLRRFTRPTNAFSKKLENLKAALALLFAWYNFCRIHSSLRVTLAMAAGLSDYVWTLGELVHCS
jgi:hypothetical protein